MTILLTTITMSTLAIVFSFWCKNTIWYQIERLWDEFTRLWDALIRLQFEQAKHDKLQMQISELRMQISELEKSYSPNGFERKSDISPDESGMNSDLEN